MFLGLAMYETLDEHGTFSSYVITPSRPGATLIADAVGDVDRAFRASAVDLGPLRMYADEHGLAFRFITSRVSGDVFRQVGSTLTASIRHSDVPIEPGYSGYYGLLLPTGYTGDVSSSITVAGREQSTDRKLRVMTDTEQLFVSSGFYVYGDQYARPSIQINASLRRGSSAPDTTELSTFGKTFGGYIDGLHDNSVANLIREINKHLGSHNTKQVFVCHSTADKAFARRLAHALSGRGVRVWIDEAEIGVGDSLIDKIESGILSSNNLIVVMTPRSVSSRWCKEELRMALAMQINGERIKVLPALFEDCEIPGFLREKAYADFRVPDGFMQGIDDLAEAIAP